MLPWFGHGKKSSTFITFSHPGAKFWLWSAALFSLASNGAVLRSTALMEEGSALLPRIVARGGSAFSLTT
jgi:hypothetical protein